MHQHTQTAKVFHLPSELVTEIIKYLVDCGPYPCDYCKRLLVPVALSMRVFATPVFERLWADLGGLSPLLNLLPSSLRKNEADDKWGTYDLHAPIPDSEWESFAYYARFVRHLRIARFERISKAAFDALLARAEGSPLLPKLQKLQVDAQEQFSEHTYKLIPSSPEFSFTLHRRFDVDGEWASKHADDEYASFTETVLDRIYARAPTMKKLTLNMSDVEDPNVMRMRTLAQFSDLRALTMHTSVTAAALLEACAQLPHLATLEMYIPVAGPWYEQTPWAGKLSESAVPQHQHPNAFAELRKVTIKAGPSYVADILSGIRAAHIRTLKISTGHSAEAWDRFMHTICDHFAALQDVFLSIQSPILSDDSKATFWDYFGLLTGNHDLRHIRLAAFEKELAVTDDDIHAMASAWPLAETLMLEVAWKRTTKAPSLESLQMFAQRCPALRVLELPCPEPIFPSPSQTGCWMNRSSPSVSKVKEIWLTGERWTGENGERCVGYVRDLFPQLGETGPRFAVSHSVAKLCKGGTMTHINFHRPLALISRFPIV